MQYRSSTHATYILQFTFIILANNVRTLLKFPSINNMLLLVVTVYHTHSKIVR